MMKRLIVAAVIAATTLAFTASPCWACTCMPGTKKQKAEGADAVFFARVRSISGGDTSDGTFGDDNIRVKVRVLKVYKGRNITRRLTVRTNESAATCGYEGFRVGRRYTIFADKRNHKFFTSLCSGTKRGDINPSNYGLPAGRPPEG